MPPNVNDPIADLARELDAEATADAQKADDAKTGEDKAATGKDGKPAAKAASGVDPKKPLSEQNPAEDEDDEQPEPDEEEAAGDEDDLGEDAKAADDDKVPAKKSRERLIPVSERNKEAAARRKAERQLADALAENAALKATPAKDGDKKDAPTPEQMEAVAEARARLKLQLEEFVNVGAKSYGMSDDGKTTVFDAACNMLSDMGAPPNLVAIAIEAAGGAADAAKLVYRLSQEDPAEIERVFTLTPVRQVAALARLSVTRPKRSATTDDSEEADDEAPQLGRKAGKVSKAPPPVRPLKGANKVPEGLGDDVPEEVFTERFFKELEKPRNPYTH